MKFLTYRFQKIFLGCDPPNLVLLAGVNHGENAVIRGDETLAGGFHQDGPARCAHSGIDDHHVHRAAREIAVDRGELPRPGGDLLRRDRVRDIDHLRVRSDTGNDAFHHADKTVNPSKVSGEGNKIRHRSEVALLAPTVRICFFRV